MFARADGVELGKGYSRTDFSLFKDRFLTYSRTDFSLFKDRFLTNKGIDFLAVSLNKGHIIDIRPFVVL